jgi:hypothetical protein
MDRLLNGLNAENPNFSFLFFNICKNWGEITFRLSDMVIVFHSRANFWAYMNNFKDRNPDKNWKCQAPVRTLWTPCACLLLVFLLCRMDCYKQVSTMLDHLYDQRTASSYSPSVTVGSSVPASQDAAHLSQSEANDQVICYFFLFFLPLSMVHPPP